MKDIQFITEIYFSNGSITFDDLFDLLEVEHEGRSDFVATCIRHQMVSFIEDNNLWKTIFSLERESEKSYF